MNISNIDRRTCFNELVFSQPNNFRVDYSINPYMENNEKLKNYRENWVESIKKIRRYATVRTVDYDTFEVKKYDISDYPDSVFIANHGMPLPDKNEYILSNMKYDVRAPEIEFFSEWCHQNSFDQKELSENSTFEGSGDTKWHPNRQLLWLGYGIRTNYNAVEEIRNYIDQKVIDLELVSDKYYHLDVCFTPLTESEVLIIEDAFTKKGIKKIKSVFDVVYRVPEEDYKSMGGNSTIIAPKTVAIDQKNKKTIEMLEDLGYDAVGVNTEAFQKAGGSIDCLFLRSN